MATGREAGAVGLTLSEQSLQRSLVGARGSAAFQMRGSLIISSALNYDLYRAGRAVVSVALKQEPPGVRRLTCVNEL